MLVLMRQSYWFELVSLIFAYVNSDFSNFNVFQNSHSDKPLIYKITGAWGNHEGSIFIWVIAIPFGIISAVKQYSFWDYLFTFLGFVGLAIPDFMIALIAMYLFFVWFDFSPGGLFSPEFVGVPWSWNFTTIY